MFNPPILQGRLDILACEDLQSGAAFLHAKLAINGHQAFEFNNPYTVKGADHLVFVECQGAKDGEPQIGPSWSPRAL
jgi:hypothetical protein